LHLHRYVRVGSKAVIGVGDILMQQQSERAANLHALASRLEFTLEKTGDRFPPTRTADVARPVHEEGLTFAEAEKLLETWKLRGTHGD
jgi:hypothetical protein